MPVWIKLELNSVITNNNNIKTLEHGLRKILNDCEVNEYIDYGYKKVWNVDKKPQQDNEYGLKFNVILVE
jgi:hypothetical protein